RRADLRETMSDYLIRDLGRFGVVVRDRSEIAELHGEDGNLEAVTLTDGERLPLSFLFCFLGAEPCTDWLETSVPGVFAVGDVRAGSLKRCATAVGEGATVVRLVHDRLAAAGVGGVV
ncbi:MAG TPA: hypothetical protein PKA49_12345, partial [Tepidiformaceae bacterium]|nr:hypothetical protein [Tepidiformaceae bacterium]